MCVLTASLTVAIVFHNALQLQDVLFNGTAIFLLEVPVDAGKCGESLQLCRIRHGVVITFHYEIKQIDDTM